LAHLIVRKHLEDEEEVIDVLARKWSMGNKLDDYKDVEALAVTITKNTSIDMLRKRKYSEDHIPGSGFREAELSPSPHDQMVNSEITAILTKIISDLPSQYREIVQLREIEGFSYEEIAQQTDININSLRVNLSRARRMIREEFIKYSNERGKT